MGAWDFSVFVDVSWEAVLARGLERDARAGIDSDDLQRRYTRRYIAGQRLYIERCRPHVRADVVIDNENASAARAVYRS